MNNFKKWLSKKTKRDFALFGFWIFTLIMMIVFVVIAASMSPGSSVKLSDGTVVYADDNAANMYANTLAVSATIFTLGLFLSIILTVYFSITKKGSKRNDK